MKLGQKFDGWELSDFKPADETLILKKDGRTEVLKIANSSVASAPNAAAKATIADAQEVLQKMDFERMMTRMLDQQNSAVGGMAKQMAQGMGAKGADADDIAAFQKKAMETMFDAMKIDGIKDELAKVYSEVFTKDELHGLSDFYSTPAGQAMVDKQPEISQKLNAILMPRMMAAMPKIQAMAKEFAASQAAKREAAAAAAASQAEPAPAPPTDK